MYQEAFIDLQLFFEIVACIRLYKARYIVPTFVNSNSKQAYLIIVITHLLAYVPTIAIAT